MVPGTVSLLTRYIHNYGICIYYITHTIYHIPYTTYYILYTILSYVIGFAYIRDPSHNISSTTMTTNHTAAPTTISSARDIGATATSPAITTVTNSEDTASTKLGVPASPIKPIETVPHVIKSRQNRTNASTTDNFPRGGKKRSTGDGLSSSPSNFTPLHPRMAGGREGYSRDGGVILSRSDPSMFGSVSDAQHCVKIIDESLMWDDRGADVSNVV